MRRVVPIAVTAALAGFALAACGGGGTSDEDQIREVSEQAITSSDPAICDDLATQHFIDSFYSGSISDCKKDVEDTSDNPDSIKVEAIKIDGDKASADITYVGGPSDGQGLFAEYVKEEDQWKFDNATASSTPSTTGSSSTGTGTDATGATGTGTSTTSGDALTELFFSTIRQEVTSKGLSNEIADCIVNKLRQTITPQEIEQIKSGQRPGTLAAKSRTAGQQCAQQALSGD